MRRSTRNLKGALSLGLLMVNAVGAFPAESVKSVRLLLPSPANAVVQQIGSVFTRQIQQRCDVQVVNAGEALLTVELAIAPGIGTEGFRIEDRVGGGVRIVGNDERGLLYGIGKFLRTGRYDAGGFTPGTWRGTSVPQKPVRGIYFATHFHNFYHDAPVEEVQRYVEDLGLWGFNALAFWYDMRYAGAGIDDPAAVEFVTRLRALGQAAKGIGLDVALIVVGNESYTNAPVALRADARGMRGAVYPWNVCPSKPEGMNYILKVLAQEFDWAAGLAPHYVIVWPYDSGGCGCAQCRPWGSNGFLEPPKAWLRWLGRNSQGRRSSSRRGSSTKASGRDFTRRSPTGDLLPISSSLRGRRVPCLLACRWSAFLRSACTQRSPGAASALRPCPAGRNSNGTSSDMLPSGGFPYSEGIYEDITKAVIAQLYWNDRPAEETLREYAAFEYSPAVADDVVRVIATLEQNHHMRWWPGKLAGVKLDLDWFPSRGAPLQADPGAEEAYATVQRIDERLSQQARQAWRWRLLLPARTPGCRVESQRWRAKRSM